MKARLSLSLKLGMVIGAVALGAGAFAGEVTWKGGGATAAWSDGSNWVGGTAPGAGDTVVITNGSEAIACNADYTYMNADATKFAGIRIEAGGTMTVSNMTAGVTHSVPLSGAGLFRGVNTKNNGNYSVKISADNSAYTGEFYFKECGLYVNHKNALGTSGNKVTHYGNSGANRYLEYGVNNSNAEIHWYGGSWLYYGPNDKAVLGPHCFHASAQLWGSGSCSLYFKENDVTYDGASTGGLTCRRVVFEGSGTLDLGGGKVIGDSNNGYSGFALSLGKRTKNGTVVEKGQKTRLYQRANVCDTNVTFNFTGASSYLELQGGFSQRCGNFTFDSAVTSSSQIYAPSAAKLTVHGTANRDVKTLLNGKLSFALESDNDPANPGVFNLVSPNNTMDGSLSVSCGTLTLGAESTFSNVTALVSTNAGVLVVNATDVNPKATLTTDAAANLTLNSDMTVTTACVGDYYLPVDTYDETSGYFTGTGHLTVLTKPVVIKEATYVGTTDDFTNPANWEGGKLPDFEHGEVRVTMGKTGSPATMTIPSGIHVYGIVLKGEVATTLAGEKLYLGTGGITCEKPDSATVANVLDLPIETEVVPQSWTIPSDVSLQVKKPMTGTALLDYAVTISGGGTLTLDADSRDLEPPLNLDNLTLRINHSYALGSTNRYTKIKAKAGQNLFFKGGLVNYVPIELSAYGTVTYFGEFGVGYTQAGAAKLSLLQTICNGYTFAGGLFGSGQYYSIGSYSYTISGKPMNMPEGSLYNDATTLYLKSTGNVFGSITQVKGATYCQTNNALCATGKFEAGRSNAGYTKGTLDLGGFDQDIGALYTGKAVTVGDAATYVAISSAKPAIITTHDATSRNVAMKITGMAGYAHAGAGTYSFYNQASDTKGALKVLAGGVKLMTGASFSQVAEVSVAAGAKLTVSAAAAANAFSANGKSKAVLHLTTGDTNSELALEGGTVTVNRLYINGVLKTSGIYDKSNCAAITGDGWLEVLKPTGLIILLK